MHEYIVNLHMHTPYSDGRGSHQEIAQAALRASLDVVIVTDHNVWIKGHEGYFKNDQKRVLLMVGEEVHDETRDPQKNHMLIFGAEQEMAHLVHDSQQLIDRVRDAGGLSFIAHPVDPPSETFGEADLSWVDWEVQDFTGIELWNAMSEFKSLLTSKIAAIYYAFNPSAVAYGPFKATLDKWDELLNGGKRVVAIGGSDAHALIGKMGPIKKILFPYEFHFQAINTHILTPEPFRGNLETDKLLVLDALKNGRAFIGYDLPASTKGFNFRAQGFNSMAWMGEEIKSANGVTLQIRLPHRTECHLIKDGQTIKSWNDCEICTHITSEPGSYRVEAYHKFRGKRRGWIFSNPIYLR
jgi:predicted metal-dependent phosphoesterase TrpH